MSSSLYCNFIQEHCTETQWLSYKIVFVKHFLNGVFRFSYKQWFLVSWPNNEYVPFWKMFLARLITIWMETQDLNLYISFGSSVILNLGVVWSALVFTPKKEDKSDWFKKSMIFWNVKWNEYFCINVSKTVNQGLWPHIYF